MDESSCLGRDYGAFGGPALGPRVLFELAREASSSFLVKRNADAFLLDGVEKASHNLRSISKH